MPNYLSQYRSTFGLERLEKNGDYDGRTITINVSDFGTIVSSVESSTDARNNAMVFVKAYEYALTKICSMNVEVRISVPAGDYYFPDNDGVNDYIILNAPQYGQIGIYGAGRDGTRPTADDLNDGFTATKTKLKNYYRTRFHFTGNGFSLPGSISGTTRSSFLFNEIAFFGSSDGYNEQRSTTFKRAFSGSYKLNYCAIHGFTTTDETLGTGDAANSYGIDGSHSDVSMYSIIITHCGRAIYASNSGGVSCYSPNDDNNRDIITRTAWEAILSSNNSSVRVGDGTHFRSCNTGGNGASILYAFNNGTIVSRLALYNGTTLSSTLVLNGGVIQTSSSPEGG